VDLETQLAIGHQAQEMHLLATQRRAGGANDDNKKGKGVMLRYHRVQYSMYSTTWVTNREGPTKPLPLLMNVLPTH